MRYHKPKRPLRPTVEDFSDSEILDVNLLHRQRAFAGPVGYFPLRYLKTYRDRIELTRPARTIAIVRTRLHSGGLRPWFICPRCRRRCARLYLTSIDVACRICSDLWFTSQRKHRPTRLRLKAKAIRAMLWSDQYGRPLRPRRMGKRVYQRHIMVLTRVQAALSSGSPVISVACQRYRNRDAEGRYCSVDNDLGEQDA
jgi:hypothetical protein